MRFSRILFSLLPFVALCNDVSGAVTENDGIRLLLAASDDPLTVSQINNMLIAATNADQGLNLPLSTGGKRQLRSGDALTAASISSDKHQQDRRALSQSCTDWCLQDCRDWPIGMCFTWTSDSQCLKCIQESRHLEQEETDAELKNNGDVENRKLQQGLGKACKNLRVILDAAMEGAISSMGTELSKKDLRNKFDNGQVTCVRMFQEQ